MKKVIYEVYIKGEKVKEYPHRIQAIIYLFMKGYVYGSRYGSWISSDCEIREVLK